MTERDRLALQYEGLVYKIARQFMGKVPVTDDDVLGYAWEGLVLAMNKYKEGTSQSFAQYAAYQIRYNILNRVNTEGHIVKFSAYNRNKARIEGNAVSNIKVSLNVTYDDNGDEEIDYAMYPELIDDGSEILNTVDVNVKIHTIQDLVRSKFSDRDYDVFCKMNGIGTEKERCVDIAHEHHISITLVSLINKRIMDYVRNSSVLDE